MSVARSAVYGLYGAWRFARFDRAGLGFIDSGIDTALRSFWANAFVLPAYWLLQLLAGPEDGDLGILGFLAVEGLSFAVKLCAYLLAVYHLLELQGRADRFPAFVTAYNWASVLQMGAFTGVTLAAAAGLFPTALAQFLGLAVFLWAAALGWFIARHTLDVAPPVAVGLVLLELLVTAFINNLVDATLLGPVQG